MELLIMASSVATLTRSDWLTMGLALFNRLNIVFAAALSNPVDPMLLSSRPLLYPISGILLDAILLVRCDPWAFAVRARGTFAVTGLSQIKHLACIAAAASELLMFKSPTASVIVFTTLKY